MSGQRYYTLASIHNPGHVSDVDEIGVLSLWFATDAWADNPKAFADALKAGDYNPLRYVNHNWGPIVLEVPPLVMAAARMHRHAYGEHSYAVDFDDPWYYCKDGSEMTVAAHKLLSYSDRNGRRQALQRFYKLHIANADTFWAEMAQDAHEVFAYEHREEIYRRAVNPLHANPTHGEWVRELRFELDLHKLLEIIKAKDLAKLLVEPVHTPEPRFQGLAVTYSKTRFDATLKSQKRTAAEDGTITLATAVNQPADVREISLEDHKGAGVLWTITGQHSQARFFNFTDGTLTVKIPDTRPEGGFITAATLDANGESFVTSKSTTQLLLVYAPPSEPESETESG